MNNISVTSNALPEGDQQSKPMDSAFDESREDDTILAQTWKSHKHASTACKQIFRKLWTFMDKQQRSCQEITRLVLYQIKI